MCGIIGIVSRSSNPDRNWLTTGRDTMQHRGPDDAGEWWSDDGRVGLGHRRLSIIDLSPAGHQPMLDATGKLCLVFNGEIYNYPELRLELQSKGHTFISKTDTEVILAAYQQWGTDCVRFLRGMFAFGLYDAREHRMFLARDRAGEKPLFYRVSHGVLTFASELKALLANPLFPRRIDRESLDCYLSFGYVPGNRCIIEGVNKLPPAHALTLDLESMESHVWRYWKLPEPPDAQDRGERDGEAVLQDELEHLLQDAVKGQLVADVPVGILLSGGVDSSLITAMAVRCATKVRTFTIRFPGHGEYDETEHARRIAYHFGTEHIELEAEPSTVELLPSLARQFDEPMVDSSMVPTFLVSRLVRQYCTVALGGDGGDELFGGYVHYSRLLWLRERMGWIPLTLRRGVAGLAREILPMGTSGRNWLQGLGTDLHRGLPLIAAYFDKKMRQRLLPTELWPTENRTGGAEAVRGSRIPESPDLLQRATRMDFENYLAEDILVKIDRASMLNSLEVRAPWLDHRIIELAFSRVPSCLKASATNRKLLPKRLCQKLLPSEFDVHRKQGFSIPLASWLRDGDWGDYFRQVLLDSKDGFFDHRCLARLLDDQRKGRSNSERLFALVLFELWRREYRISF